MLIRCLFPLGLLLCLLPVRPAFFSNQDGSDAPTHAPRSRDSFERDED